MKSMEQLSNLSDIKDSLPGDVLQQLQHVNIFNMCTKEHFPDEQSCITFAQGFGLMATKESQILHCKGNFCQIKADRSLKFGFRFKCANKKPRRKERCLTMISPCENTFFRHSRFTMHDIFKLVMSFVSRMTVTQVVEQLSYSHNSVIAWYASCREVCKVILANEYQRMIHRGVEEVDDLHLHMWKQGFGRKRKWDDDVSSSNDERNENYLAEHEYRRRYFKSKDMMPLPLSDKLVVFWYHIKLVFPGPGKVGLMYPNPDCADDDGSHAVNTSGSTEATTNHSSHDTIYVELISN